MNRRFVRSVRRAAPDRPGAHRVNRSAVDGCSSTPGTASRPSADAVVGELPGRPQQVLRPLPPGRHRLRHHVPGERRRLRRHRRRPPPPDIGGNIRIPGIRHTALILNAMRGMRGFGCDNENVSPTPAQQARAAAIAAEIAALAAAGFALPGTLTDRHDPLRPPRLPLPRRPAPPPRPLRRVDPQERRQDRHPDPHRRPARRLPAPGSTTTNGSANWSPSSRTLSLDIAEADPRWNR